MSINQISRLCSSAEAGNQITPLFTLREAHPLFYCHQGCNLLNLLEDKLKQQKYMQT